jgi:beta-N-acetylhexosaminidase
MLRRFPFLLALLSLLVSFLPAASARASGQTQTGDPQNSARQMLAHMTPEERIGQLLLVTFTGSTADSNSQIYSLIHDYHVGGVMLLAAKDNFVASPDTVTSTYQLISQLQTIEYQASQAQPAATSAATLGASDTPAPTATIPSQPTETPPNYIPLFVGISQPGDGSPDDQILSGLTPLPDLMAIGATWDTSLAEKVGAVAGQELSSLGFNLYFGPSLDVLETPESTLSNGLGASVFGGDPFWVGAMGSAYISGLHTGSNDRLTVIADHFPGRGSADRPEGSEPATVRKSLEQLKQVELAPFFSVTGNASTPGGTADGLLVSHIRYQGFQGNIRSITPPVSFDPQALSQILSLQPFASWRESGGLMVSDDLGSPTVRRFYDPAGTSFLAWQVARDALLAGNDLLYMGNIVSSDALDNYSTVVNTLNFFDQKYQDDKAFAQRVDDAVVRILTSKYRLYGNFNYNSVLPPASAMDSLGLSQALVFQVASQSATLISPNTSDLDTLLPSAPAYRDQVVFLTDTRTGRQCSTCSVTPMLAVDALQKVILRLYGPGATGQVSPGHLLSYTFTSLNAILAGGPGDPVLEATLRQANWVVINMLDAEPGEDQTTTLHRFLSERQDLLREKRIVVFAFNAPYFLDATDISKLTAYYCLYSKADPFVEVAARLLFKELTPKGSLPVSVEGVNYDLLTATGPDPSQVIGLSLELPSANPGSTPQATPAATATPYFQVGDTVSVRTSTIVDHNGHPVPDGTQVHFTVTMTGAGGVIQQMVSDTSQGVAAISFSIPHAGLLEVYAASDPALTSVTLQLNVYGGIFSVTVVAPTQVGGPTSVPTATAMPTVTPTAALARGYPGLGGWFGMFLLLVILGGGVYWLGSRFVSVRWGVRWTLCMLAGGLLAYSYLAARLPGASAFLKLGGWSGMMGVVLLGAALGLGAGVLWQRLPTGSAKRSG